MRRNRTPLTALLLAATSLVALSACSSNSKSIASTTSGATTPATTTAGTAATAKTTVPATTNAPATTRGDTTIAATTPQTVADTVAETSPATNETATTISRQQLQTALHTLLLTPQEVGPNFVLDTFTTPPGSTPCGINVDGQVPSIALTGTQIVHPNPDLAMIEEIRGYGSTAEAKNAYDLATTGFSCGKTDTLTLGNPTDVSGDLKVPSIAVTVSGGDVDGVIVIALVTDAIVVFQFQSVTGAPQSPDAPNPIDVSAAGLAKIQKFIDG